MLQVTTGKEQIIKNAIDRYSPVPIEMLIFRREIFHFKKGNKVKVLGFLFPGYIFVYKYINLACEVARKYFSEEYIHPISSSGKPLQIYKEEMLILLRTTGKTGTFRLSRGLKVGDKIKIIEGPLDTFQGKILWIDEKKKKAKIELFLFKRRMSINLGFEIIEKNIEEYSEH